ncbi:MAG: IPT/TIG domain-containing protein [Agriterribacter sp.]
MNRYISFLYIGVCFFILSCSKSSNGDGGGNSTTLSVTGFSPSSGKENSVVTITGSGFGTDESLISISFNGSLPAIINSITNTQLVVEVPVSAATGKLQVGKVATSSTLPVSSANDFTVVSSYTQMPDFGGGLRNLATALTIGNKAYVGLGSDGVNSYKLDWWAFDPATNAWTRKADFPGSGRVGASAFAVANKGYVCFGSDANGFPKDVWEYDPASDKWTQKKNFEGLGRSGAFSFSSSDKGYVVSGFNGVSGSNYYYGKDVWEYNASSDTWTQKNDFPGNGRTQGFNFTISGTTYVGGGFSKNNIGQAIESVDLYSYNSANDSWTSKTGLGLMGYANSAVSVNDKGHVLTGYSTNDFGIAGSNLLIYTSQAFTYDPTTDKWKRASYFPGSPRSSAIGFSVAGRGFVGIGYGSNNGSGNDPHLFKDVWEFSPAE